MGLVPRALRSNTSAPKLLAAPIRLDSLPSSTPEDSLSSPEAHVHPFGTVEKHPPSDCSIHRARVCAGGGVLEGGGAFAEGGCVGFVVFFSLGHVQKRREIVDGPAGASGEI